ncbi:hypothetical protein EMIT0P4_60112 [Pseudomonas sp. IT-P4]
MVLNYEYKHSVRLGQTFTMSIVHSLYLSNHLGTLTILLYCPFFNTSFIQLFYTPNRSVRKLLPNGVRLQKMQQQIIVAILI